MRRRPTAVPLLGVLAARGYGPRYDVLAGIALQRVLLTATARSLTASFFPQALEVQGMAGPFTAAVTMMARRSGVPRMVLRLGYAPFRVATARRDIDEVIF